VKPLLKKVRFQRHAKGTFPYLGWQFNSPLTFVLNYLEKFRRKGRALFGITKKNQGPWPLWKNVVSHERFKELVGFSSPAENNRVKDILGIEIFELVERSINDKDPVQRLAGLQVRLWSRMMSQRQLQEQQTRCHGD
jgi:hypothetical protein